MRSIYKTLMVVFSIVACVGAVLGWALSGHRQAAYQLQGNYEQHG